MLHVNVERSVPSVCALVAAATATAVPGSVKSIFLTCKAFTGNSEHGQAVMSLTKSGSGNNNAPLENPVRRLSAKTTQPCS